MPDDIDLDGDGLPVTVHDEGAPLPGNTLAWERLGVGHRCETWLAWSIERWCPAVVKFPRPHQIDHPRARATLCREVQALAGNVHPALPRLFEDGSVAAAPYVVFEYLDGMALDEEVAHTGALGPLDVALLGAQVLAALRTVHRRGLAHVDIKPANVMLADARPVLLDFGSARPLGAAQPSGPPIGSPGYASPDLEAGEPISTAMDMFGLGVTLHEALTGRPAFDPDLDAPDRPAAAELVPSVVAALVEALMAPDARDRPDPGTALHEFGRIAGEAGQPAWPEWASGCLR